jgi:pyruvate/2-oxoglutarate dehydrogenase complex dihydrolipoamide acyltransferase (E2) component
MVSLVEIDVTAARAQFRKIKERSGRNLSFTAWLVKCIGVAVGEHPEAAAFLKSRRSMLVSGSVDISITVEKDVNGYKIPLPYVIRDAQSKSILDIHSEIRTAQNEAAKEGTVVVGENLSGFWMKLYYALPAMIRRFIWKRFLLKPYIARRTMGSVMVTSVGMACPGVDGWLIPTSVLPLCFAVGGIIKKPGVAEDAVAIHEYLKLTVLIDHDVMDGAPAARFIARLSGLMKNAYGLEGLNV